MNLLDTLPDIIIWMIALISFLVISGAFVLRYLEKQYKKLEENEMRLFKSKKKEEF